MMVFMQTRFETKGTIFFVAGNSGERVLVGLDESDYIDLLGMDLNNTEIKVEIDKGNYGAEYSQIVPHHETKAGIYTIKMDGTTQRFQLDIDTENASILRRKGFTDGEVVSLVLEKLPYKTTRTNRYSDLKLDIGRIKVLIVLLDDL